MSEPVFLSRRQIREVDRRAMEDYGIPGVVLMENAGRNATTAILEVYEQIRSVRSGRIAIVCGSGNNGGDGFVIARHAMIERAEVDVYLACDPTRLTGDALINYEIAEKMHVPMYAFATASEIAGNTARLRSSAIIVDAILGTGFSGQVRSPIDLAIAAINDADMITFAIDVPSGLDCDTGEPSNATVRADTTITFVAMKTGFQSIAARELLGEVLIADIGAPVEIIDDVLESCPEYPQSP